MCITKDVGQILCALRRMSIKYYVHYEGCRSNSMCITMDVGQIVCAL